MFIFVQVQVEDPGLWAGEGERFNHPDEKPIGTGIHTGSISRIALKLHFVHNLKLTQKLGKKGRFAPV